MFAPFQNVQVLYIRLRGSTPHPYFYLFGREVSGASLGLVLNEVIVPGCIGTGSTPYPYFYPFDRGKSGASVGLVPNEVIVPGCFGTNRKIYISVIRDPSLHSTSLDVY